MTREKDGRQANRASPIHPVAYARTLAGFLRAQDHLLVDGELYSGKETLGGYDNPINRRFAWAPLHAVGIRDDDGELRFETEEDAGRPGLYAVTKHFVTGTDTEAMMGGQRMTLEAGERVSMSRSGKYSEGVPPGSRDRPPQAGWTGSKMTTGIRRDVLAS